MPRIPLLLILSLFAGLALAGCIGGDESKPAAEEEEKKADDAVVTEETGSVTGQVVTNDLELVVNAAVGLIQDGAAVMETDTDQAGKFTFNGVTPGLYRVQVASPCCRVGIREVEVVAGKVAAADMQLARLTSDDLQVPFVDEREWSGFIACGVGTLAASAAVCSFTEGTPAQDPNEDFLLEWNVSRGVRGIAVGMSWDPVGGVSGGEFSLLVENDGCGFTSCSYRYADLAGPPPLLTVVNDGDITEDDWKWTKVEEPRDLQFRVFASGDATLVYQQPFTVHYHTYYWQEAPRDANPIPDQ